MLGICDFMEDLEKISLKVNIHQEKIKSLEEFKEEHEEEHQDLYFEHKMNCKKIQLIENSLKWVLGIVLLAVLQGVLDKIIK